MAEDRTRIVQAVIRARNEAGAVLGQFQASLVGITAAAAAVAGAVYAVEKALSAAVKAASQQETADVKLAAALRTIGQNTGGVRKEMIQFASDLQSRLGIADEEIQGVMATLIQFGRLSGENLKRATQATLDYAASTGGDAKSAALALSKALEGGTARLAGIAVKFKEGSTQAERFDQLMGAIERTTGGTAAALGDTFTGALDKVDNAFSDLLEVVGDLLIKNPALSQTFTELVSLLGDLTTVLKENSAAIGAWITAGIKTVAVAIELGARLDRVVDSVDGLAIGFAAATGNMQAAMQIGAQAAIKSGEDAGGVLDKLLASLKRIEAAASSTAPAVVDVADKLGKGTKGLSTASLEAAEAAEKAAEALRAWEIEMANAMRLSDLSAESIKKLGEEVLAQFDEAMLTTLISMNEAMDIFVNKGVAGLNEELRESALVIQGLGDALDTDLRAAGVNSALTIGDALVDAATGAEVSFKKLFESLLRDLAKSIVRSLILRAILASVTGGGSEATGGAFAGFAAGEIGVGQHGGDVRGGIPGRDSVLALLQPGEIVLPVSRRQDFEDVAELGKQARGAGRGSFTSGTTIQINNHIEAKTARRMAIELLEEFNVLVERKGFTLAASHIVE